MELKVSELVTPTDGDNCHCQAEMALKSKLFPILTVLFILLKQTALIDTLLFEQVRFAHKHNPSYILEEII